MVALENAGFELRRNEREKAKCTFFALSLFRHLFSSFFFSVLTLCFVFAHSLLDERTKRRSNQLEDQREKKRAQILIFNCSELSLSAFSASPSFSSRDLRVNRERGNDTSGALESFLVLSAGPLFIALSLALSSSGSLSPLSGRSLSAFLVSA